MCPPHSRATFQHLRRLVAAGGTFLTGRFVLTLLLAVGIDADGRNVILAWAVVESENRDSWEYFLRLLRRYILEVSSEPCVLISDRDKGLLEADAVLGERYIVPTIANTLRATLRISLAQREVYLRCSRRQLELSCLRALSIIWRRLRPSIQLLLNISAVFL
jgi:transposase-like protein